jgi:hypothetical protein
VAEVLAEQIAAAGPAGARDDDAVFGADPFGVRRPPAAPDFLAGYDYPTLPTERRAAFLRALDLVSDVPPRAEALRPGRLGSGPTRSGPLVSRGAGAGFKRIRVPYILHTISFGGPLHRDGGVRGQLMDAVADLADQAAGDGFETVLWTDVTRAEVAAAGPAAAGRPAQVREFVDWAATHRVRLVNVDEVFNAGAPMHRLDGVVRTERARQVPAGYEAASQAARIEIVHRFGGVYTGGGTRLAGRLPEATRVDGVGLAFGGLADPPLPGGFRSRHTDPGQARGLHAGILVGAARSAGLAAFLGVLADRQRQPHAELAREWLDGRGHPTGGESLPADVADEQLTQGLLPARPFDLRWEATLRTAPIDVLDRVASRISGRPADRDRLASVDPRVFRTGDLPPPATGRRARRSRRWRTRPGRRWCRCTAACGPGRAA